MKALFSHIKVFFANIIGFLAGWHQVNVSQRDIPYSFYGFNHFKFAKQYANKRHARNGLKHWVVPAGRGAEQLIVFNTKERKAMQHSNMMSKKITAHDLMKAAYHTSQKGK